MDTVTLHSNFPHSFLISSISLNHFAAFADPLAGVPH
jgi:hypothetical protein